MEKIRQNSVPSFNSLGSNVRQPAINTQDDATDIVDSTGAGYSYFKKQQVDARPSFQSTIDIPSQDLSAYMQASAFKQQPNPSQIFSASNNQLLNNAFGQQQLIPRSNLPVQNLLPRTNPIQQPIFHQNDFAPIPSNGFGAQQVNLPIQRMDAIKKKFANQPSQDLRLVGLPKTTLNGFGNQQQDLSFVPQPQQTWSTQQQSAGFSSSFGGSGQKPVSSSFLMQSNQQNDQPPVTNAVFMSSQVPPQRFISPPKQISNNGW
jgi:hypothetical protein